MRDVFRRGVLISIVTLCVALVGLVAPLASAVAQQFTLLSAEEYVRYQPNELGRVPVFMYHNIVSEDSPRDPSVDPYMYRTRDELWNDMLWLYQHDFYLVGLNGLISGNMDVPLGKHPVVFTFDDASSLHFSVIEGANGGLVIDPDCAVGIMERFYAEYPKFGRGAHFGLVPANKFSWPQHEQDDLFETKILWLIDNGYEVGNHTLSHPDLTKIDDEEFAWTVSGAVIWGDEFMGADHPGNATRVLTVPFGITPKEKEHPSKVKMLHEGFTYENYHIQLIGILELTGGSSSSPWSKEWNPMSIPRLPVQNDIFEVFAEIVESGVNQYYTSDGEIETVSVPWPLPDSQAGMLSAHSVSDAGKTLIKYDPITGHLIKSAQYVVPQARIPRPDNT